MGAYFNTCAFKGTKEQVSEKWNNAVEQAGYEHGHIYSGSISELGRGFHDTGRILNNRSEAEQYIEEHQEKWSGAIEVRF